MNPSPFFFLLLFLTAAVTLPITATGISPPSLDALLYVLRSNGHTLLANSIATSDLFFDLLSLQTLTLLAPPDPSLFALDMTLSHIAYLSALRLHVIPTSIDLNPSSHSFAAASSRLLPTLHPSRELQPSFSDDGNLLLDGVPVLLPRVHHSREFSVYRLRGPLPSSPAARNNTVLLPPPRFRRGGPRRYPAPVGATAFTTPVTSPSHPPASQEMPLAPSVPPAGSFPALLHSPVDSSPLLAGNVLSSAPVSQQTPLAPGFTPVGSIPELLYSPAESSPLLAGNVLSSAPVSQETPLAPSFTPVGSFPELLYSPVESSHLLAGNVLSSAPVSQETPSFTPVGCFPEPLYSPVQSSSLSAGNVPSSAPVSQEMPLAPSLTPAGSFQEFLYSQVSSSSPAPATGSWRGVGFKAGGEECGPLDTEKMLCSLGSVSDASVHVNSRNDVAETDGHVVDDYSIRRFADYGL